MKRRRQFDIKNGVITNIKPYEIVAIIVSKLKIFGEENTRDREIQTFLPMYWYANSKEEAEEIKNLIEEELSNEIIDGNVIVRHLSTIVVDIKAKRILEGAGTNKGIERTIICSDIPTIDENAFDEKAEIINMINKPKTKKRCIR